MLGDKIKKLRLENSLTQKDLAEKLYVTAQAVSRWENNEVEPSIATLGEMAKIFNVSISELIGEENKQQEQVVFVREPQYESPKPVLAVCEHCNDPIYDGKDIVRTVSFEGVQKVLCRNCDTKIRKQNHQKQVAEGINRRTKSFVWGGIFSVLIAVALLLITSDWVCFAVGIFFFPFISCLYLGNTFIADMVTAVASWSIRMPGLIFTLDLDGIIWFLTVKLILWLLGALISILCLMLAVVLGYVISIIVYPFAIVKSYRHPEYEYI